LAATTLRFAKEGLPIVNKSDVRLCDFIEEVQVAAQPWFGECVLRVNVEPGIVSSVDGTLLQRVLDNLIRNAVEAGASDIEISWMDEEAALRVCDDGRGLAPRAIENLFVPFAGSARPGGSGLGLPISRVLMRAQGGDLLLESTGADGTCFLIMLAPHSFDTPTR
ncbi:MAG: ATP-binding protein, partial [Rhodospirillaceae bacterium]